MRQVWCNPWQDMQSVIQPAKVSPFNGALNTLSLMWKRHTLPVQGVRFHAYQIGQIHPKLLGLLAQNNEWVNVAETMEAESIVIELFTSNGIQLSKTHSFYKWTADKNLIFITQALPCFSADLNTQPIYIRLYSNHFFQTGLAQANGVEDYVRCIGQLITTASQRSSIIGTYNANVALRGVAVRGYVNGFLVKAVAPSTCRIGDYVEIVIDTSIKQVITYPISSLQQFTSTKDAKFKYLIKSPIEGTANAEIVFYDDVDFYVVDDKDIADSKGVYYHQSQPDSVRMLTHVDYAIPVAYLDGYNEQTPGWGNLQQLHLKLFVRHGGSLRSLPNEQSRIKDLYRLPWEKCANAMLGIDSTIPYWRAEVLEESAYTKLMSCDNNAITPLLVGQAYGYNAISRIVGDSPVKPVAYNSTTFMVPYLMRLLSTAYEYDQQGHLLGVYLHYNDTYYYAANEDAALVEFIYGRGGLESEFSKYGLSPVIVAPDVNFRCYKCRRDPVSGKSLNDWVDVTDTGSYLFNNGVVTWTLNPATHQGLVRFDNGFLAYNSVLSLGTLGYMVHTLPGSDPDSVAPLHFVPMAQYDFWLNGKPLIEGIDYIRHDFNVLIFSKAHIVGAVTNDQLLTVRGVGFCNDQLMSDQGKNTGFINTAVLTQHSIFKMQEDKVLRVIIDGALKNRDDFTFDSQSQMLAGFEPLRGKPYQIKDMIVPFGKLVTDNVYRMRQEAQQRDLQVKQYLDINLPPDSVEALDYTAQLYPLYSPFLAAIIKVYQQGTFRPDILLRHYTDDELLEVCKPFEWILAFDPTQDDNTPDREYVMIHPTASNDVISVPLAFYTLLQNIVRVYLHYRVSLSHFITLADF